MFGLQDYEQITKRLNNKRMQQPFLIAVHRGSSMGNIIENTIPAFYAAIQSGADILEIDVIRSKDGQFYLFHDGNEKRLLSQEENIRNMVSSKIEALRYYNNNGTQIEYRVEKLAAALEALKGSDVFLNLDRTWNDWDTFLPYLDQFDMADQIILKSPVQQEWLSMLDRHPVKYTYMPIVKNMKEIEVVLNYEHINLVGVELIARDTDSDFFQEKTILQLKEKNWLIWLNAIVLDDQNILYAKFDDDQSILKGPDYGWGTLVKKGCDVIQTDWPSLLADFRRSLQVK